MACGGKSQRIIPLFRLNSNVTTTTYSVVITTPCRKDTLSKKLVIIQLPVISSSGNTSICREAVILTFLHQVALLICGLPGGYTNAIINVSPNKTTTYTVAVSEAANVLRMATITVTGDTPAVLTITPNQKNMRGR